jgi:hypothetical protein
MKILKEKKKDLLAYKENMPLETIARVVKDTSIFIQTHVSFSRERTSCDYGDN